MASRPRKGASGAVVLAAGGTGGHLFPGPGAGRRTGPARLCHPSDDRRAGARLRARAFPPSRSTRFRRRRCRCEAVAAAGELFRLLARLLDRQDHPDSTSSRWRSSASAAIRPSRRCSPRRGCKFPTVIHDQNAVHGPRQPGAVALRHRDRLVLSRDRQPADPALKPKVDADRQSRCATSCSGRWRERPTRRRPPTSRSASWSSAAARARGSSPTSCPTRWPSAADGGAAAGSKLPSNAGRKISSGCARPIDRLDVEHEAKAVLHRHAASASPTRISSSAGRAHRPSPSCGVIGRPAILVPLPHAIDNDQLRNAESFATSGRRLGVAAGRARSRRISLHS